MTQHHPSKTRHDYLPAAGRDAFLPFYDVFTRLLGTAKVHGALVGQAGLAPGHRVLEIGCGTGTLSVRAKRAQPGVELIGSDPDPLALARAQRKARGLRGIRFEQGYAQRLPYPDGDFDRVLSALMLHHLDPATKAAAVAEVYRVLRPGGRLHLVDFAAETHGLHGFLSRRMVKAGHVAEDVAGLLTAAAFDCTELAAVRHPVLGRLAYYRAVRPS